MDQLIAMRTFIRVAETGNFSTAAHELETTQATISKRIAWLEQKLGARLLIRSSREQSLTESGSNYLQRCVEITEALEEADNLARAQTLTPSGSLRITAAIDFARPVLTPLLREFMAQYPEIRVELILDNYQRDLVAEGIDLAIRSQASTNSTLIARHLCANRVFLVASPTYLQRYGTPVSPQQLNRHHCLLYAPQHNPRHWQFRQQDETIDVMVDGRFRCDNGDVLCDMALAGEGLTILPYWIMYQQVCRGQLKLLLTDYQIPTYPLQLVYPERKHLPLKIRVFIDFLLQRVNGHPAFNPVNH